MKKNTVDNFEIEKFEKMAKEWWDPEGKFKPLHMLGPSRLKYIIDSITEHYNLNSTTKTPLEDLKILDIGCGGGLVSVPISRLGAKVTGIDASEKNIKIASAYADMHGLKNVDFVCNTVENMSQENVQYDVVLNLEVIEHVANPDIFIKYAANMIKPGGIMILSTLNKTLKSYAFAIIGAEYVMRWLPVGTHDFKKFLKPSEINNYLVNSGLQLKEIKGLSYNLMSNNWSLSDDIDVNYMMKIYKPVA